MQEHPGYHLVQLSEPEGGWSGMQALSARARAAAAEVDSPATPVRFLRSIFVPEDGTCFQLFRGTATAVTETLSRADLAVEAGAP